MKYEIEAHQTVVHRVQIDASSESQARELFTKRPKAQEAEGFRRLPPVYGAMRVVSVRKLGRWNEPGKAG